MGKLTRVRVNCVWVPHTAGTCKWITAVLVWVHDVAAQRLGTVTYQPWARRYSASRRPHLSPHWYLHAMPPHSDGARRHHHHVPIMKNSQIPPRMVIAHHSAVCGLVRAREWPATHPFTLRQTAGHRRPGRLPVWLAARPVLRLYTSTLTLDYRAHAGPGWISAVIGRKEERIYDGWRRCDVGVSLACVVDNHVIARRVSSCLLLMLLLHALYGSIVVSCRTLVFPLSFPLRY